MLWLYYDTAGGEPWSMAMQLDFGPIWREGQEDIQKGTKNLIMTILDRRDVPETLANHAFFFVIKWGAETERAEGHGYY